MVQILKRLWQDEEGPTAVEYGLMVALIAVVIIVAVQTLGGNVQATFEEVSDAMP
jgi:pilus assembly protein Flp/PilA